MQFSYLALVTIASKLVVSSPIVVDKRAYHSYDIQTGISIADGVSNLINTVYKTGTTNEAQSKEFNQIYLCPMTGEIADTIDEVTGYLSDLLKGEKLTSNMQTKLNQLVQLGGKLANDLGQSEANCDSIEKLGEKVAKLNKLLSSTQASNDDDDDDVYKRDLNDVADAVGEEEEGQEKDEAAVEQQPMAEKRCFGGSCGGGGSSLRGFGGFFGGGGGGGGGGGFFKRADDDNQYSAISKAVQATLSSLQSVKSKKHNTKGVYQQKFDQDFVCEFVDVLDDATEKIVKSTNGQSDAGLKQAATSFLNDAKKYNIQCSSKLNKLAANLL